MDYNPQILNSDTLLVATDHEILVALYKFLVASICLFFASAIFIGISKFAIWFLPKYWHRPSTKDVE